MKEVSIISKIVGREVDSMNMPSASLAGSVDLSGYLKKEVWDEAFEIKELDGTRYLSGKYPLVLQYGLTTYADEGMVDLPSIYDGLPIDNQTIVWEEAVDEAGNKTKVLKVSESAGTIRDVIVTGDGNALSGVVLVTDEKGFVTGLEFKKDFEYVLKKEIGNYLKGYATEGWVKDYFLPLTGGTLTGDLRLKDSSNYGMTLYFGDGSYCFLQEDADDHLTIYASNGISIEAGLSKYIGFGAKGIKVNGGILTYNPTSGYWELEGDLLVTGGVTSYE